MVTSKIFVLWGVICIVQQIGTNIFKEPATSPSVLDAKDRDRKFLCNGASLPKHMLSHTTVRSKLKDLKRRDHFGGIDIMDS